MRGTILNAGTVAVGASVGLLAGHTLSPAYQTVALHGIGLVAAGFGIKMFLDSKQAVVAAASVALGGVVGLACHLQQGVEFLGHWSQHAFGGSGEFAAGMITAFVLFCVGPLTVLGCIEDAVENRISILALKATMDGISAFFLAAATGAGVLLTAVLLLIFQGGLTLAARPLQRLLKHPESIAEASGAGGAILLATGIGLIGIANLKPTNYLPAIFLAPLLAPYAQRIERKLL